MAKFVTRGGEEWENSYDASTGWSWTGPDGKPGNPPADLMTEAEYRQQGLGTQTRLTQDATGNWVRPDGSVAMSKADWEQYPAAIREMAGNDLNKLNTGIQASGGGSYQYKPGTQEAIYNIAPGQKMLDWSQAYIDPTYGLVAPGTSVKPSVDRLEGFIAPALLAGLGGLVASGAGFGAGAAGGDFASSFLPTLTEAGGLTYPASGLEGLLTAPTGTGAIAGATGGIGDLTTLLSTGGALGGSAAALPLGAQAASTPALFGGDQMINSLMQAPTASGVTQVPGISQGGLESILQGGAGASVPGPLSGLSNAGVNLANSAGPAIPGAVSSAGGAALPSAASNLAKILKDTLGIDVNPSTLGLIGTLGSTALGAYGANQQANALTDIANQSRNDRLPALNAFNNALANPDSWYSSAPSTGALDAVLRKLSVTHGNPALDPGAMSKAAAYNLGGYNDYLAKTGSLGLSGQAATTQAQTNAALAGGNTYNAIGSGLASLTNNQQDYSGLLTQLLQSRLNALP